MPQVTITTPSRYTFAQNSTYFDSRFGEQVMNRIVTGYTYGVGTDTVVRNSNPDWKLKIAKRLDASSYYLKRIHTCEPAIISCETYTNGGGYFVRGLNSMVYLGELPSVFPSTNPAIADMALSRLKRKIQSQSKSMNAVVPVIELRELRDLVSGSAKLTTTMLQTLIDIKRTKGKSAAKFASDAWLTWSFGMSPLIAETKNAAESISEYLLRTDHSAVLSSAAGTDWLSSLKYSGITGTYGASVSGTTTMKHELSYRYTAGYNFPLQSSNDYGAVDHFGLEIGVLAPALWELTAFSWVFDYFTTAGAWLDDTFTSTPGNSKYITLSRKYRCTGETHLFHVISPGSVMVTEKRGNGKFEIYEHERTVLSALPHRQLRFKTTDEIGKNWVNKALNLASVLGGSLKPFKR